MPRSQATSHATFVGLDGLRGVAAVLVVVYHIQATRDWDHSAFSSGYLAVDLFFMLSGFVIGNAYERRLREGMGFRRFAEIRIVRLYPLYALGTLLGVGFLMWQAVRTSTMPSRSDLVTLSFNVVGLPRPSLHMVRWFPFLTPAWSLFFELAFNLAYALFLPVLTTRRLALIALVAGGVIAARALYLDGFASEANGADLLLRTSRPLFGLAVGLVLFRYWATGRWVKMSLPAAVPIAMFVAVTALPHRGTMPTVGVLAAIFLVIPAAVVLGVNVKGGSPLETVMTWLGALSYPLYALHFPILQAVRFEAQAVSASPWTGDLFILPCSMAAAWLALKMVDEPVRASLTRRLRLKRDVLANRLAV